MIARICGKVFKKEQNAIVIDVNGIYYEVIVPNSVLQRMDETKDSEGRVNLITYHYIQTDPSRGMPVLIGFMSEVEKDFFQQFIKVSGIGPRAAVKALDKPISEIVRAIDEGDLVFLKTLPGIGMQRAKEVVAKLQGKVGKFGLIQDGGSSSTDVQGVGASDFQDEVLSVLLQLQYKKQEALDMIKKALGRTENVSNAEDLLNEIYKQRVKDNG
ncbi:MAG: Holliday junction branch migration protein RuvA [Candidatus Aceula meridiana]|nr:Holliday junction branch migration protein RuvA [Candidatus Aceula meridiana]